MTPAGAELTRVPDGSAAHEAAVRTGWVIDVANPARWLTTCGATPQQHAQVAARNFMAMTGPQREFTARDHCGNHTRWNEIAIAPTLDSTLRWRHLDRRRTYVQLDSFDGSLDLATGYDTLLTEAHAHHSQLLILDLRGNTGGALTSATALRDRFLHAHTQLGSIAFTTGTGQLADPVPLTGDPSPSLSISTALTYDRNHRCIELNGLPVDGPATAFAR